MQKYSQCLLWWIASCTIAKQRVKNNTILYYLWEPLCFSYYKLSHTFNGCFCSCHKLHITKDKSHKTSNKYQLYPTKWGTHSTAEILRLWLTMRYLHALNLSPFTTELPNASSCTRSRCPSKHRADTVTQRCWQSILLPNSTWAYKQMSDHAAVQTNWGSRPSLTHSAF